MIHIREDIEKFVSIFEATPGHNALIKVDPPVFTVLAVTDDYLTNSKSSREELVGKGIFESFPSNPDDLGDNGQKNLLDSFQWVIRHKKAHQLDVQRYDVPDEHGNFTERYWVAKNAPAFDEDGDVAYIIHSAQEITGQVTSRARENVMKSLELTSNVILNAPFATVILKGEKFAIEFANERMFEIFGKNRELLHKPIASVLPEMEAPCHITLMNQVLATEKSYHGYESPLTITENGEKKLRYFNFVYQPYYETGHTKPTGIVAFVNDVTEKISIKTILYESEERFRTMAESTEVLIAVGDETSKATYFNIAWTHLTGRPVEEFMKFGWVDLIHPDDRESLVNLYLGAFEARKPFSAEFRISNKDGQYSWLLAKAPPRFKADGSFAGYISSCIDITERKQAEQALLESSQKFQKLLESLPQMTWTNLPSGEINFYSTRWYNYTGLIEGPVAGKTWCWKDLVHPNDMDATMAAFSESLKTGNIFVAENRYRRNDGVYRWHLNRALPIKNDKGETLLWIGTATDIHDLKQADAARLESEQRIRALVTSAPFPIGVYIGEEMRIELANQSILDVWGKGNDVIGKLYSEILPELDNQQIFTQLKNVFTSGIAFHAKNQRVDLVVDGMLRPYYFNYSFTPLFDSLGNVYGVMNTAADVTDLALAKKQIEDSAAQLRSLVMSAPIGICIVTGEQLMVEVVNDSFLDVVGKKRADFNDTPYWKVLPELTQFYAPIVETVMKTGIMYRGDEHEVTLARNGKQETLYFDFVYDPVKEIDGTIIRVMIVAIEVTEQVITRRKIEEVVAERTRELGEANSKLKKSNDELAQFAYIASHDLQEPLRKVSTFSQMLEQSLPEIDDRSKNFLAKINSSAMRMTNLIKDVLAYSQLSKENEVYERVKLSEVVEWVKNDFELLIEQKQATVEAVGLPVIRAIHLQMLQLVTNLISNALKFSTADVKPVITITSRIMSKEELVMHSFNTNAVYYNIEFRDNGIGFNQEHATRIFNIFQRLHGKTDYSGTGIGLAMCKKIVQNHHGDISASSSKGSGAIFNVMLPEIQDDL